MKLFWLIWGYLFPYKTWQYRLKLYRKIKEKIDSNIEMFGWVVSGYCGYMDTMEPLKNDSWTGILWKLPELYQYKPFFKSTYDLWWDVDIAGSRKRAEIIDKIVKSLENKLLKKHRSKS